MSTSYNSGVILGVKLSEIDFKAELVSVPYDVFDKKGKKTGKIEYDKSWKFTFKGVENIEEGDGLYSDSIEEIINVQKPLNFWNLDYENSDFDNMIVGIDLVSRNYNDWSVLKEVDAKDQFDFVKNELKNQFGVDVEPKLYYYFQIS
jgi:hypothetical protein